MSAKSGAVELWKTEDVSTEGISEIPLVPLGNCCDLLLDLYDVERVAQHPFSGRGGIFFNLTIRYQSEKGWG